MISWLLIDKMKEHGEKQMQLAEALGMTASTLSLKINGKSDFTNTEMRIIKKRYDLSEMDMAKIFFD